MAGTLIVSNLKTDTDNSFIVRSNTGTTLFVANTTGIDVANSFASSSITSDKILTVANTKISGNIISSQIASVNGSVITANTIANSAIQTGAVENYMNAQGLSFGMRNRIINGAMAIAQRGTTSTSTGYQTVDRWQVNNCTNQAQVTSAPTGFINSLEITGTVAGSSGYGLVNQYIESKNVLGLLGNNCTLSAWVKNTGTSTVNVSCEVYYANTTDNFSAVTLISSPTSQAITTGWTRITFPVIAVPSAASTGIAIRLFRYDGSNSQKWEITGVQFELGSTATSFDYLDYGRTLIQCQRYFQLVYPTAGNATSSTIADMIVSCFTPMRTNATLNQTGVLTVYDDQVGPFTQSSTSIVNLGNQNNVVNTIRLSNFSGMTANRFLIGSPANPSNYVSLSAEL